MLIGRIGKAFEPSLHRPAKDREEQHGGDRGEHRGASRGTAGNGFLTILIAGSRRQLIDSHFQRKSGCKSGYKSGCQWLAY